MAQGLMQHSPGSALGEIKGPADLLYYYEHVLLNKGAYGQHYDTNTFCERGILTSPVIGIPASHGASDDAVDLAQAQVALSPRTAS